MPERLVCAIAQEHRTDVAALAAFDARRLREVIVQAHYLATRLSQAG